MDGFRDLMEEHREVSRGGGDDTAQQVASQLVGAGKRATEFVGYSKTDVLTAVIDTAPAGGTRQFVKLEQSPFYAASGGQVSDRGYLVVDGEAAKLDVVEVLKFGDDQVLVVELSGRASADGRHACPGRRELGRPVPDAGEPHRDASAAPGAPRRARRPCEAGGLGRAARQAALRLHARAAADAGGARPRRAHRQRQGVRGDPGAHVRDADRRGAQARRDDVVRREVRRRGARRRDRRLLGASSAAAPTSARRRRSARSGFSAKAPSAREPAGSRRSRRARRGRCSRAARGSSTTFVPSSRSSGAPRRSRSRPRSRPGRTSCGRTSKGGSSSPRSRARVAVRCATSPTSSASARGRTQSCSPRQTTGRSRSS